MVSHTADPNVSPVNEGDKPRGELPVMGGRATEEQIRVVDMACAKIGKKRGHFVVETAVARAHEILEGAA